LTGLDLSNMLRKISDIPIVLASDMSIEDSNRREAFDSIISKNVPTYEEIRTLIYSKKSRNAL
jgi:hypothetical protein